MASSSVFAAATRSLATATIESAACCKWSWAPLAVVGLLSAFCENMLSPNASQPAKSAQGTMISSRFRCGFNMIGNSVVFHDIGQKVWTALYGDWLSQASAASPALEADILGPIRCSAMDVKEPNHRF